ncbi:MAG TPA: bifunctional copper resistance protein CopD/cytochrome c oxidase assembly protein [Naasia sp.]|jgi:putative copper resistance protein D
MPSPRIDAPAALSGPGLLLGAALLALLASLAIGGGAAALLIGDPGPVVRFGLPAAKLLVNLTAAATIGFVAVAALMLPPGAAAGRLLDAAAGAAGAWTVASALTGLLTFLSVTGVPLSLDEEFGGQLGFFLTSLEPGRAWLTVTLVAAAVTVLCFAVRSPAVLLAVLALAAWGLTPLAEQGHAAEAASHEQAVSALGLHLLFAALWLGGLLALVLLRPLLAPDSLLAAVRRYSAVALVCFVVVAASGYVSAEIRVGSLDRLASPYGVLVVIKVLALLGLGVAGALHRRATIRRLAEGRAGSFWRIVLAEVVVMGVASGAAAALARTASPVREEAAPDTSAAALLTGESLPAQLDALRLLTATRLELGWLLGAALALTAYVVGVLRLRSAGKSWPRRHLLAFTAGAVVLAAATNGAVAAYERQLFSMHAALLALLLVAVPALVAAGRPLELLRRATPARDDGSRGAAEWTLAVADSRGVRFVLSPLVAGAIAAAVLLAALLPPVLLWSVRETAGRDIVAAALLLAGTLVASARGRRGALAPAVAALAAAGVGAYLLVTDSLLLADWYGAMGWGSDASADQRAGGAVLLIAAALPLVVFAVLASARRSTAPTQDARISTPPSSRSSIR